MIRELKGAIKAIVVLSGLAGAVWLGVEIERRLSVSDISDAESRGYASGYARAEADFRTSDRELEFFARLLGLIKSDEAEAVLPEAFRKQFSDAVGAAEGGDFEAATRLLPENAMLVEIPACIPSGRDVNILEGDFVDQCESGAVFVVNRIYDAGPDPFIEVAIDGKAQTIVRGGKAALSEQCNATLLRFVEPEGRLMANIRFKCGG
jgi:hypothetical protein